MSIELAEIRDFLVAHPPFDLLPGDALQQLPKSFSIRYLRRGQAFPPADAEASLYLVRQGVIDIRNAQGVLIEKLAEGELYSALCERIDDAMQLHGKASEDSLLYALSCERFQQLSQQYPAFAEHFSAALKQSLWRVINNLPQQSAQGETQLDMEVGQLIARKPITASPDMRIVDAARLMTDEGLSSLLLVENGALTGLITDRDLRSRCIAAGRDITQTVREIMSTQVRTIDSTATLADALLLMNRHNVHHLPVMQDNEVAGILSSTDLIRQQGHHPLQLVRSIHKAQTLTELVDASAMLRDLQAQLFNAHTPAYRLGQIMSSIGDALTQRLLTLAQTELGEAPIAFAWLAAGSLARQEMTAGSDQDNALLLSDDYAADTHGEYFARLAQFVCDGLDACGIVHCPGEVMASNPRWRQPLKSWREYFTHWILHPDHKGVMEACNFFDLRVIAGDAELLQQLFPAAVAQASANQIFLAHLAANATRHRIPLGFFRQFVLVSDDEHHDQLDIKLGGLIPLTELVRLFALAAGVTRVNTYERLQAMQGSSVLSQSSAADLHDALDILNTLRLRHQALQHTQGLPPDNFIDPQSLSQVERQSLKQAFSILRDLHKLLAQRYQTERFYT
ncbi:MAG: CBS domain-containing protein [Gammaproteobacteria bacterium]|nr:CBS domain-containing protein [Gammaproteobacteria bacterium]